MSLPNSKAKVHRVHWPKKERKALLYYKNALGRIRNQFLPKSLTGKLDVYVRTNHKLRERFQIGAAKETQRLLHQVLRCPALSDAIENRFREQRLDPLTKRRIPCWTTTKASPVGADYRIYQQLTSNGMLDLLLNDNPPVVHLVGWHEFLPTDETTLEDVWDSLFQLDRRFLHLKRFMLNKGWVYGGFAMREVDRTWHRRRQGVLAHVHIIVTLMDQRTTEEAIAAFQSCWAGSKTYDGQSAKLFAYLNPKQTKYDLKRMILYAAGSRQTEKHRFAKYLEGFYEIEWADHFDYDAAELKGWRRKGKTSDRQLILMLGGLSYPKQQPRWFGAWDSRTKWGKSLKRNLKLCM